MRLSDDFSEIKIAFRIPPEYPSPNTYAPSWNVAPTDSLPIVRYNEKTGSRTLDMLRWGLVPYWAKDIKIGFSTINAQAETIESKPVFRDAFKRRRCLVPVDNFYEWKKLDAKTKQPYAIGLEGGGLMALAGLWENWKSPADEWVRSFTIVTTTPNELCAEVHNRMPTTLLGASTDGDDYRHLFDLRSRYLHGRPMNEIAGKDRLLARRLARRVVNEIVSAALKMPKSQSREKYLQSLG